MKAIELKLNKRLMIKIFSITVFVSFSFLVSCSDYLEEKPFTTFSSDQYFSSITRLRAAVLGIYEDLATANAYGYNEVILSGDTDILTSDGRSVTGNLGNPQEVAHYNAHPASRPLEALWLIYYGAINRANHIIKNASKVEVNNAAEQAQVNAYIAEAKAMRAFLYVNLVKRWGDVPLRLFPSDLAQELNIPRTSKFEVYEQIFKDFDEAIPNLPWHNEAKPETLHLNKGAVMGLYVRSLLFAGGYSLHQDGTVKRPDNYLDYYTRAEIISKQLINSGNHALNPNYENIFRNITGSVLEHSESMFEIDLSVIFGNFKNAGRIGARSIGVVIRKHLKTYNTNIRMTTSDFLSQKFADEDLRKGVSVADFQLWGDGSGGLIEKEIAYKSNATYGCAKWRRDWHSPEPIHFNNTDVNYVIIRYSDVLLMRAEILNEINNGPTAEAIELVNQVRRRGYGLDPFVPSILADVLPELTASQEVFLDLLIDENAREFSGEGNRKFHLIRWNVLQEKLLDLRAFLLTDPSNRFYGARLHLSSELFESNKDELYPIPYNEILDSKFLLTQNPGYSE